MALKKNTDLRNEQADVLGALFDSGTVEIYTGAQPVDPDSSPSGSLLATIPIPNPAFGAATGGVIAKAGSWTVLASDTGVAGWARFISTDTTKTFDVSISDVAGGNNLLINDVNVVVGNAVTVTSLIITIPAS